MQLHFAFSGLHVYFKILSVLSANDIVLTIVIAEEIFLFWSYSYGVLCFICWKNRLYFALIVGKTGFWGSCLLLSEYFFKLSFSAVL